MNWKEAAVAYLKYASSICLKGLSKSAKTVSQNSRSLGRDLNPRPPEYEAEFLLRSLHSFEKLLMISSLTNTVLSETVTYCSIHRFHSLNNIVIRLF
jgi:hypothetical protein